MSISEIATLLEYDGCAEEEDFKCLYFRTDGADKAANIYEALTGQDIADLADDSRVEEEEINGSIVSIEYNPQTGEVGDLRVGFCTKDESEEYTDYWDDEPRMELIDKLIRKTDFPLKELVLQEEDF